MGTKNMNYKSPISSFILLDSAGIIYNFVEPMGKWGEHVHMLAAVVSTVLLFFVKL